LNIVKALTHGIFRVVHAVDGVAADVGAGKDFDFAVLVKPLTASNYMRF